MASSEPRCEKTLAYSPRLVATVDINNIQRYVQQYATQLYFHCNSITIIHFYEM